MQKDDLNTIRFAAIICVVCSMALAGVQGSLRGIQERNKEIDQQVNVLKALSPDFAVDGTPLTEEQITEYFIEGKVPKEDIPGYFENYVSMETVELKKGGPADLYVLKKDGQVVSYAFPAEGKGLWSTVHSYVGLNADMATIRGITFFDHGETPGLGGECSKPWFQANFRGKVLWQDGEAEKLTIAKGNADPETIHNVDGMSGATITGNGIQKFVNKTFQAYNDAFFQENRAM
ncbi:FMN-binding protein [Kiritimatiellota bacterium B12222]|nr:FMN-binding protein [Kiritimatiellota bacterium B12222]